MVAGLGLSVLAGLLSILSPCVLPILPVVLGAAATQHRLGPAALAAGLAMSFGAIGLFLATIGFAIGLDGAVLRWPSAVMLVAIGLVLAVPPLHERLAIAAAPAARWVDARLGGFSREGLGGQFGVGLLLGAVWSPCVGPTLGAASALAAQGRDLPTVAVTMLAFGIGAAVPLLAIGLVSRAASLRWRGRLLRAGTGFKAAFGVALIGAGMLVVSGLDKRLEAVLVDASPGWLNELTTRF